MVTRMHIMCQRHQVANQLKLYTHREIHTVHPYKKPYNHHAKALSGVWYHQSTATVKPFNCTVLITKTPVILFLLCLHMISVVQIFPGSHAVRSLNSRKSATSIAL